MILIFNLRDFDEKERVQTYLNTLFTVSILPLINKPKGNTKQSCSIIDQIFKYCFEIQNDQSAILKSDTSDN